MKYSKKVKANLVILSIIFLVSVLSVLYFSKVNVFSTINESNLVKYSFIAGLVSLFLIVTTLSFKRFGKKHLFLQLLNCLSLSFILYVSYVFVSKFQTQNIFTNIKVLIVTSVLLLTLIGSGIVLITKRQTKPKQTQERYIRLDTTTSPLKNQSVNSIEDEFNKARGNSVFYSYQKNDVSQYFEEKKKYSQTNDTEVSVNKDQIDNFGKAYDFNVDINNAKYANKPTKDLSGRTITDVNKLNDDFLKNYDGQNGL